MAEEKKAKKDRGKWFREMKSELKKVIWPSAGSTAKNTGTVLLCSLIVGACIGMTVATDKKRRSRFLSHAMKAVGGIIRRI